MLGIIPHNFPFPEFSPKTRADVLHTCIKINNYFRSHDSIQISVSGGSDSDCIIHLICKYFPEYKHKCHFVFAETGLEYSATRQHLKDIEKLYDITIDRVRGKSVVWVCKQYGFPILSKFKSQKEKQNNILLCFGGRFTPPPPSPYPPLNTHTFFKEDKL